jgi:hypothetical protein
MNIMWDLVGPNEHVDVSVLCPLSFVKYRNVVQSPTIITITNQEPRPPPSPH